MNKRALGNKGELKAENWLIENQFEIVERNLYTPFGEIDLIAKKFDVYYFVEVKYRRTLKYGSSKEALTNSKLDHMRKSALHYIKSQVQYIKYKISFMGIHDLDGKVEMIWIENVFD